MASVLLGVRLSRTIAALVFMCSASSTSISPASAQWWRIPLRLAEEAAELGAKAAVKASRKLGRAATLVRESNGALKLVRYAEGAAVGAEAFSLRSGDDLLRLSRVLPDALVLPEDVVVKYSDDLTRALKERPGSLFVFNGEAEAAPLAVATRAGREELVVQASKHVSYSTEAWAKRDLLRQKIMPELVDRIEYVVLANRTDQVQRLAFTKALGKNVRFVESRDELVKAIGVAREKMVTVVGHVEDGSLVLRGSDGSARIDMPIDIVHQRIDAAESVGLMMGCDVASVTELSGPAQIIDALEVARGLAQSLSARTPEKFLDSLAERVGSFHIDTDLYGRLRAVSALSRSSSTKFAALTTRLLLRARPLDLRSSIGIAGDKAVALLGTFVLTSLMSWLFPIFLGVSPKHIWRGPRTRCSRSCSN